MKCCIPQMGLHRYNLVLKGMLPCQDPAYKCDHVMKGRKKLKALCVGSIGEVSKSGCHEAVAVAGNNVNGETVIEDLSKLHLI